MNTQQAEHRYIQNEAFFRQLNEKLQAGFDRTNKLANETKQFEYLIQMGPNDPPLYFFCECSDENCTDRVPINLHQYKKIHKNRKRFVIMPEHHVEDIEKVIRREADYFIVEKKRTPPEKPTKLNSTAIDNS